MFLLNKYIDTFFFSYDQTINGAIESTEKNENKLKFESTMKFVEDYLAIVVQQPNSFADREQNKLTHEVKLFQQEKLNFLFNRDFSRL